MAITAEDMQKMKNDVKERTTLLLALPDEHQLRFNKYDSAKELWEAILETFGGNEATRKTKKNQLKHQYGNFKAEGSETLEQTFNRLQAIITKESRQREENYKKDPKVEETAPNTMIAIGDVPTEYALMAKSSSSSDNEVYDDSFCSKSCRKNIENLNTKISKLNEELSDCKTDLYNYKRGLSQVDARLVKFKENKIKYCEKIRVLERDIELKDNKIKYLRNELEEVKKEKESIDFKIEKFKNASKDLDRLLESQKLDKGNKGVGFNEYCVIPPPPAQVYSPLKKDLSWMGLPQFVDDIVTDYTRPTPSIDVSKSVSKEQEKRWKSNNPSFFEQGGSSDNVVSKPMIKFVKESGCPNATKVNNKENTRKPTVKYAEIYKNTSQSPRVRGNKRN
nr:xylulose kinase-1 [Tanacetum cinerariifolium]